MLLNVDRERVFGKFRYTPAPSKSNPEKIKIDPKWVRANITSVKILVHGTEIVAWFHKLVAQHAVDLFATWNAYENLAPLVRTFNGSYAPRFIRGSEAKNLSAHSYGSAFDINARWNRLGKEPAPVGSPGSVIPLVEIAEEKGWVWGGRWRRPDGMHFEWGRC